MVYFWTVMYIISTGVGCFSMGVFLFYIKRLLYNLLKCGMHLFPLNILSLRKYISLMTMKVSEGELYRNFYSGVSDDVTALQIYDGLLVRSPDVIKQILLKTTDKHETDIEIMEYAINRLVYNVIKGWDLKGTILPIWEFLPIKQMHDLMKHPVINLELNISEIINKQDNLEAVCNISEIAMKYTINTLGITLFGEITRIARPQHLLWPQILTQIRVVYLYRRIALASSFVNKLFPKKFMNKSMEWTAQCSMEWFKKLVLSAIEVPERSQEEQKQLIDILNTLNDAPYFGYGISSGRLTYPDYYALVYTAGLGHASNIISFALYELAYNRKCQTLLRQEIRNTIRKYKDKITYDRILEMNYLEMIVAETLRKYPPIPVAKYVCTKKSETDLKIGNGNFKVPIGTAYYFSALGLHMDPKYYPEPDVFDPLRFSKTEFNARPRCCFIPFGISSSALQVSTFCKLQTKLALISILRFYHVKICAETIVPLKMDPLCEHLKPLGDVKLLLQKI